MNLHSEYDPFDPANMAVPKLSIQIAEAECFHCGRKTRFPVQPDFVNYEAVAERYRVQLQEVIRRFNKIIDDIDVMQPEENPIRQYIHNEWEMLLLEIKKKFDA